MIITALACRSIESLRMYEAEFRPHDAMGVVDDAIAVQSIDTFPASLD